MEEASEVEIDQLDSSSDSSEESSEDERGGEMDEAVARWTFKQIVTCQSKSPLW